MIKASISLTAKQVVKNIEKGLFTFDNVIQRSFVWDKRRKSDLIHSLIEDYPVPAFYAVKKGGKFDFLDGKQRTNAVSSYINGKFVLLDVPQIRFKGEMLDINGKHFDELPEEIQDRILDYSFILYYFEDITEDEVCTMFLKLNNGKALSTKERNIAKCRDIAKISRIGEHEIFSIILSAAAQAARKQIPLVVKTWVMLFDKENAAFTGSAFNRVMTSISVSEEEEKTIMDVYEKIIRVFENIEQFYDAPVYKKVKRKMSAETHLITAVPYVKEAIDKGVYDDDLADFFVSIYREDPIISEEYKLASTNGSARASNIQIRDAEFRKAWDTFLEKLSED